MQIKWISQKDQKKAREREKKNRNRTAQNWKTYYLHYTYANHCKVWQKKKKKTGEKKGNKEKLHNINICLSM